MTPQGKVDSSDPFEEGIQVFGDRSEFSIPLMCLLTHQRLGWVCHFADYNGCDCIVFNCIYELNALNNVVDSGFLALISIILNGS